MKQTAADDIDLLVLVERGISFFRKYRWLFISAIIVGLVLGYLKYLSKPKIYRSRLILHSYTLTNPENIQIVKEWQDLLRADPSQLAVTFNMPVSDLVKLKRIKADEIQKVFTPNNPNGFIIDVYVTDNSILDTLEKGIVHGFANSEYVGERLQMRIQKFTELVDKTSAEIDRLDSKKTLIESLIEGKRSSNSSVIIDGATINRQLIELNEKLLHFKEELKFSHGAEVLQGFSKYPRPIGPNLYVWLFIGLASCLCIAYIYALIDSINKRLKERNALSRKQQ
jgi:uncharacterized protein involved in exopolysaccharide biosynthesis